MQIGFINKKANVLNSCIVPIDFTHSCAIGQTGCGKTTGYIYPNLEERIKNNHGILLYDYKGKEHLSVKYFAKKYNRLDDVIEIGKDWGSSINIIKYMNKAQLFEFFRELNGTKEGDMFWANSSSNICTEILSLLKTTNKILKLCNAHTNNVVTTSYLKRLINVVIGFEMLFDYSLPNLLTIVSCKKNILKFITRIDNFKLVFTDILSTFTTIKQSNSDEELYKYLDVFNELINFDDKIEILKIALAVFNNEAKTSEHEYTTLDSMISSINTPLSSIASIKSLNNDELDIIEALKNGKIIVINTNAFSNQIISALNTSIFSELSKNASKVAYPISIFIDEAQKVISESFELPIDILRECKVELFLSFQNEELIIEKLGLNKFNSLIKNFKQRYIFKNPTMYKNIEDLSKLDIYEYYNDTLMDFNIYKVDKPLYISQKDLFEVEFEYQKIKRIKEKYEYKFENQNHILIYDDAQMEDSMIIIRDDENRETLVNVYKTENVKKAIKAILKIKETFYSNVINLSDEESKKFLNVG